MDATTWQALAQAPVYLVLIYLLVKAQSENEKLLKSICDIQAQNSKDMQELTMKFADKLTGMIRKDE